MEQAYEVSYNYDGCGFVATEKPDVITKTAGFVAACGLIPIGIASVDYFATKSDEDNLNVNEYRDANTNTMNAWISGIEDDVARNPDQVTICRESCTALDSGTKTDTYDVTQQDGLSRYLTDQISVDGQLNPAQKEALTAAIDTDASGQRLAETDQQQITELRDAVTSYVATVPDREPVVTNDNTGELFVGGSLIIVASIAVGAILGHRQRKQIESFRRARKGLIDQLRSTKTHEQRMAFERITDAVGLDRHPMSEQAVQPEGGGEERRQKLIERARTAIQANEDKEKEAAESAA